MQYATKFQRNYLSFLTFNLCSYEAVKILCIRYDTKIALCDKKSATIANKTKDEFILQFLDVSLKKNLS